MDVGKVKKETQFQMRLLRIQVDFQVGFKIYQNPFITKGQSLVFQVMLGKQHVKIDQEVMDMKRLMDQNMLINGSKLLINNFRVDYLTYNNCNHTINETKFRFFLMQKSLNETKRPIFFSLNDNGNDRVWQWGSTVANSWRIVSSNEDSWSSFLILLQKQIGLQKYATVGGWNYPGSLMIGSNTMSYQQKYVTFVFWCIWKTPLLVKGDLASLSQQTLDMLSNQQLIAINQDSLGLQAKRIKLQVGSQFKRQVWGGQLSGNNYVVVFFNRGQTQTNISISLKKELKLEFSSHTQRDPIRHVSVGISNQDNISLSVAPHSVEIRILSTIKQPHLMFQ